MNRNIRKIIKASIISVCLIAAGLVVYFFAGRLVVNHFFSDLNYAIVSGQTKIVSNSGVKIDVSGNSNEQNNSNNDAPADNTNASSEIADNITSINEEDWIVPTVGEQYAVLTCESIGLDVPVYCGDTDEILGKHDTTFFAPLEKMKENDEVILSTTYGKYTYKVSKRSIIKGADIDLSTKEDTLILYTCYPFGEIIKDRNNKIIFECSLVEGPSIGGGAND